MMLFSNMEYPGKNYRVQVYDEWLGEPFEAMDNPQDGDKIVYRKIGTDGQPVVDKTEVFSNGSWTEEGSSGDGGYTTASVNFENTSSINVIFVGAPIINHAESSEVPMGALRGGFYLGSSSVTLDVVLKDGMCRAYFQEIPLEQLATLAINTTGGVSLAPSLNHLIISGAGTVTISNK